MRKKKTPPASARRGASVPKSSSIRPPKVGTSRATTCILVLLFLMVSAYVVFQIVDNATSPYDVSTAYTYEADDETTFFGYVVRDESVLPSQSGGELSLEREEGERVGRGQTIATIYSDSSALEIEQKLDELYSRLDHLNFALEEASAETIGAKLDSSIQSNLFSLQENLNNSQFAAIEKDVSELKSLIVRRDYSSGTTVEELQPQIDDVKSQIESLKNQQSRSAKHITAERSGLFSAVTDGYESVLTPDALAKMTPTQLAGITPDASVESNVGKLIYSNNWYYAANMDENTAATYKEGASVTLRFIKELDRTLDMTVYRVSDAENGQKLVVFRCSEFLPEVTLLRRQSASIIHESYSGIRVPTEAIRIEDDVTGVYCLVGMQASFKPVDIIYQGDGYYLVEPSKMEDETENTSSTRLRIGDSVLVTAQELYPGKVIHL